MKKTILYSRVSTEEQAKEGHSLFFQRQQLEDYCHKNNIRNFFYYEEDGKSGKNLNREKLKQLGQEVMSGEVERIVVLSVDRLTRNIEDYIKISKVLESLDVELVSLTENLSNDAMGEFLQHILIAKAQMERKVISERTKRGIIGGLEKGRYTIGGRLPLGVSKTKDNKLFYNKDIEIVKYMFELDRLGYSYTEISKLVKGKYNKVIDSKSKISRLLNNPLYRGYRQYEGKKYYFLDPIIKDDQELDLVKSGNYKIVSKRKRNLSSHNYLYKKYLGDDFYVSTTKKRLANGTYKIYKYYINKQNKNLKINENQLTKFIEHEAKSLKVKKCRSIDSNINKLNQLYVLGDISKEERDNNLKLLKKKEEALKVKKQLKVLDISKEGKIHIVFNNNRELNKKLFA